MNDSASEKYVKIMANGVFYSINLAFKESFILRISNLRARANEISRKHERRPPQGLEARAVR
jgi:hypothetical protein